jgi:DNA-binding CsgD family transcriptional regulator
LSAHAAAPIWEAPSQPAMLQPGRPQSRREEGGPRMSDGEIDQLVAAVHKGVFEEPHWSGFLEMTRRHTGADYVSLVFRRTDARLKDLFLVNTGKLGEAFDPQGLQGLLDQSKLPYDVLEPGRPYALPEIVKPDEARHAAYRDYLERRSIGFALVIRVADPDGGSGWLTIGRSREDFDADAWNFLVRIGPHLSVAARTLGALERERMRAEIAADAVRRLNFGWVTFDARGMVIEIDAEAERLFRKTPELSCVALGQAFPLKGSVRRALLAALDAFAQSPNQPARAIHLVDEPWIDMLAVPIRSRNLASGAAPAAVGYVHGLEGSSAERCEHLMQLFALTRSEARIALALSRGRTIAEAAGELGLTLETARNYSKKIYAKTGARGQADLVRIILASVIALT